MADNRRVVKNSRHSLTQNCICLHLAWVMEALPFSVFGALRSKASFLRVGWGGGVHWWVVMLGPLSHTSARGAGGEPRLLALGHMWASCCQALERVPGHRCGGNHLALVACQGQAGIRQSSTIDLISAVINVHAVLLCYFNPATASTRPPMIYFSWFVQYSTLLFIFKWKWLVSVHAVYTC